MEHAPARASAQRALGVLRLECAVGQAKGAAQSGGRECGRGGTRVRKVSSFDSRSCVFAVSVRRLNLSFDSDCRKIDLFAKCVPCFDSEFRAALSS